jgi:hypothetical protein
VLVQDRCMMCTKHTIGMKSFWTHSVRLLGDEAQVEARFGPCMVCVECIIGSKIVLKAPNGTPR